MLKYHFMYSSLTSKRYLKVWGTINDRKVVVLVDCGASHNFVSLVLAQRLQLALNQTPYFVELGDGHKI